MTTTGSPQVALDQLRRDANSGTLARLCQEVGIDLLVAFGSATDPEWPVPPEDLDLAVATTCKGNNLAALEVFTTHLGFERIDVLDLGRAHEVARAQALGRGELLYESTPGVFAEQQILALVQQADTK